MYPDEARDAAAFRRALREHVRRHPDVALVRREIAEREAATARAIAQSALEAVQPPHRGDDGGKAAEPYTDKSLDWLQRRLAKVSDAGVLAALVRRLYFQAGELRAPATLIRKHPDLVATLSAVDRTLCDRVLGAESMWESADQLIPDRHDRPVYIAERSRVMYCVHSTPEFHSNGYSTRTRGVAQAMVAEHLDVHVVARVGYPWDEADPVRPEPPHRRTVLERHGVPWVHVPGPALSTTRPDDYFQAAVDAFVREARICRPAVILAASNHVTGLAALVAARVLGVPFVYEVRGLWEITEASSKPGWDRTERFAWQRDMETLVATHADQLLAITTETRDELVRRGVPEDLVDILPNGVDTSDIVPLPRDPEFMRHWGITDTTPVIGFAGSLVAYEGLDTLIDAVVELREEHPDLKVLLAGSGSHETALRARVTRVGLDDTFIWAGRHPSADIPRVMSLLDVVCCPRQSLPVTEMVSPLKPLEAFSAGRPVVLSDVVPHRVFVDPAPEDGSTTPRGLLHRAGDPASLAQALRELLDHSDRRAAMGRAGRQWVVSQRQWSTLGAVVTGALRVAAATHAAKSTAGMPLSELRVGVIADEFTTVALEASVNMIPLRREDPGAQLRTQRPHIVVIESAWSGNGGEWHRGVGVYSEAEDSALRDVLDTCAQLEIPTVFWNKEDPVHYRRFLPTALRCDHVFTTDASLVGHYSRAARETPGSRLRTVFSQPFFAQPQVHHPLPGDMPGDSTVAYAGTFYGARYPERSAQLTALLRVAREYGLIIYDRQMAVPDSPYHFPAEFAPQVHGALPYAGVLGSYRAHAAHLNVNSVTDSPSMFSRRVVEIAASGGVVLSTASRGVTETFAGLLPATDDVDEWHALLSCWTEDPCARRAEAWLQLRTVMRSHTTQTALGFMARVAGIAVSVQLLPAWGVEVDPSDPDTVSAVLEQSVPPALLRWSWEPGAVQRLALADLVRRAEDRGVAVSSADEDAAAAVRWWAVLPPVLDRTWAEDTLTATQWGTWTRLGSRSLTPEETGHALTEYGTRRARGGFRGGSERTSSTSEIPDTDAVTVIRPEPEAAASTGSLPSREARSLPPRLLVAGHDLKFIDRWIDHARTLGVEVQADHWKDHAHHDEARSRELLAHADTVVCEWGLGNAVWYSHHVGPHQRLVVRVHAQELRGPYLRAVNHDAVDCYVFVGEMMRRAATASHGVPLERTAVIPNAVGTAALARAKKPEAAHTLGLVGLVPFSKRPDLAVDVLEAVLRQCPQGTLRIKGHRPEEYPWMLQRPEEMAHYEALDTRIRDLNARHGRNVVIFDPHGDDMAEWYRGIGYALSVSDAESFHLTLPDGASSGAVPLSLAWPGSDMIYPREWLTASTDEMARRILTLINAAPRARASARAAGDFVKRHFDDAVVFSQLDAVIAGDGASGPGPSSSTVPADTRIATGDADPERVIGGLREALDEVHERYVEARTQAARLTRTDMESRELRNTMQKKIWWLESERSKLMREQQDTEQTAAAAAKLERELALRERRVQQLLSERPHQALERTLKRSTRTLVRRVVPVTARKNLWRWRHRGHPRSGSPS